MATKANITIDQGTTFNTSVALTDDAGNALDLTGYTANSQIRRWYTSNTSTDFTITVSNGSIALALSSNQTANLTYDRYVYDVLLKDTANTITRVVEGIVTVNPRVSR
jgi:hypothetical protein